MQTNNRGWSAIHGENLDPKNHKVNKFIGEPHTATHTHLTD